MLKVLNSMFFMLVFLTGCQSTATKPLSFSFSDSVSVYENEVMPDFGSGNHMLITDFSDPYRALMVFPSEWKTMTVSLKNVLGDCHTKDVYRGTGSAVTLSGVTTSTVKVKKVKDIECYEGYELSQEKIEDYLYLAAALAVERGGGRYFSIGHYPHPLGGYQSRYIKVFNNYKLVFYRPEGVDEKGSALQIVYLLDRMGGDWTHSKWFSDSFGVAITDSSYYQFEVGQQYKVTYSAPIEYDANKVKQGILKKYGLSAESVASALFKKEEHPLYQDSEQQVQQRMQQYQK